MARKPQHRLTLPARLLFAVAPLCLALVAPSEALARHPRSRVAVSLRHACAPPAPGHVSCLAVMVVRHRSGRRGAVARASSAAASAGPEGLTPAQLHTAYNLPATAPNPQTVAVVDAYSDPNIEADLAVFDRQFNLPECNAANGCLRQISASGPAAPLPPPSGEWSFEISLDVETVHAVCENCQILLVEASSTSQQALAEAVEQAYNQGARVISNSFGGPQPASELAAYNRPGAVITAAAGDNGYLGWAASQPSERGYVEYPAASPHVVAVGATRLTLGPNGERLEETVWNDSAGASGGGCAANFAAPPWQLALPNWSAVGCGSRRAVADISIVGDPYSGEAIYDSTPWDGTTLGWITAGGTSMAAPIIAAAFALAGGPTNPNRYGPQLLYENARQNPAAFNAVTVGANGSCHTTSAAPCNPSEAATECGATAICLAGPGYSGAAGLGSPNGLLPFRGQAQTPAPAPTPVAAPPRSPASPTHTTTAPRPRAPRPSRPRLAPRTRRLLARRNLRHLHALLFSFQLKAAAQVEVRLVRLGQPARTARARRRPKQLVLAHQRISAPAGSDNLALTVGSLRPGRYRLVVSVGHHSAATVFRAG